MRALGLCGSPRVGGNTEQLLGRCLGQMTKAGLETQLLSLSKLRVEGCTACGRCRKTQDGTCAIEGDDFALVFNAMRNADIILVGSPVYFGSATAQIMALLDRAGYVSRANRNLFARKLGGPIVVARRAGQNFTFAQLLMWFMINDFIVPGSSYWNIAFGREPGDIQNDDEALKTLDRFTENLVWLSEKLKS